MLAVQTGSSCQHSGVSETPHAHSNKIRTSNPPPPSQKNHEPPLRMRNFMGMGKTFQRKEPKKSLCAHKIGAAISGPRVAGGKITDIRLFLSVFHNLFIGWLCVVFFKAQRGEMSLPRCLKVRIWSVVQQIQSRSGVQSVL